MHYVLTGISPKKRLMLAPDSLPFSNEMPPSIPRELWDLLLACVCEAPFEFRLTTCPPPQILR